MTTKPWPECGGTDKRNRSLTKDTVEPPNKDTLEAGLWSLFGGCPLSQCPLYRGCPLVGGSVILDVGGSTIPHMTYVAVCLDYVWCPN